MRIPENKCWFSSTLLLVDDLRPVVLVELHLEELGDVEREGDHGDGDGVHQQTLCAAHCLEEGLQIYHNGPQTPQCESTPMYWMSLHHIS